MSIRVTSILKVGGTDTHAKNYWNIQRTGKNIFYNITTAGEAFLLVDSVDWNDRRSRMREHRNKK